MLLEEHKKEIHKSLKEIQGNMNKLEALTMETQKSLKEIQKNISQKIDASKEKTQKSLKEMQEQLSQQALIMVNHHFDVFLDSVGKNFIEYFCIDVHKGNWSEVLILCWIFVWLWYQRNCGFIEGIG